MDDRCVVKINNFIKDTIVTEFQKKPTGTMSRFNINFLFRSSAILLFLLFPEKVTGEHAEEGHIHV